MGNFSRRIFLASALFAGGAVGMGGLVSACRQELPGDTLTGPALRMQSPWVNDAEFIGYFIAEANGYYAAEKLNYRYLSGGPEKISGEVLAAGNCEVALTNIDGTAQAITSQNAPFKIIGAQYQKSPLGIVSLEENEITEPQHLRGVPRQRL